MGGQPAGHIARLMPNGQRDPSFNVSVTEDGGVYALAVQPDGAIVLAGHFFRVNGSSRLQIAPLDADGTLDTTFSPPNLNGPVYALALLPDGKILIGGFFGVSDTSRSDIARLNANGTLDSSFNPPKLTDIPGYQRHVNTLLPLRDGSVLVGGAFDTSGTISISLMRLDADGQKLSTFSANAHNGAVHALAMQADGKVLVGGNFTEVQGTPRKAVARLSLPEAAGAELTSGASVEWHQSGLGVRPNRVTLDYSTDGVSWTNTVAMNRTSNADVWQKPNGPISNPQGCAYWLRATAWVPATSAGKAEAPQQFVRRFPGSGQCVAVLFGDGFE